DVYKRQLLAAAFEKAARQLSVLTQREMAVLKCTVESRSVEDFRVSVEADAEKSCFASILKVHELMNADVAFLIEESEGLRLYDTLMGHPAGHTAAVDSDVVSGIGEVNNILGSTFINEFADRIGKAVHPRIPVTTFDMLGAVLQGVMLQDEYIDRTVVCADAVIREVPEGGFKVRLIVLCDQAQLVRILATV
ncbi:MAG: hypothetical protein QUS35_04010, partial [bacterium]|nr:hypothetical protein [bacterium]